MAMINDESAFWLALNRVNGLGPVGQRRLLDSFPSIKEIFSADAGTLRELGVKQESVSSICQPDQEGIDADLAWLDTPDHHLVTINSAEYPLLLREIPDPPIILFAHGSLDALKGIQIGIVGSRNPDPAGRDLADEFARELVYAGATVTSGLALGIDGCCHQAALDAGGNTIAVAGNGLDMIYPARHKELAEKIVAHGILVSEFSPGTKPISANFPRRNRIISGMSTGVLVIQAALRSGSLITAHYAMEQGREVFAIPGSIHSPLVKGCHKLIKQGAKLVESVNDIVEELGSLASVLMGENVIENKDVAEKNVIENGEVAEKNVIENGEVAEKNVIENKEVVEKNVIENGEVAEKNVIENKDVVEKNVIENKDVAEKNVIENKDVVEKNVIENKDVAEKNVIENKDVVEKNVIENGEVAEKNVIENKDVVEKNVIENKDVVEKNVIENKDVAEKNVIENKDVAEKNVIENKDVVEKNVIENKDVAEKNVIENKEVVEKNVIENKEVVEKNVIENGEVVEKNVIENKEVVEKNVIENGEVVEKNVIENKNVAEKNVIEKKDQKTDRWEEGFDADYKELLDSMGYDPISIDRLIELSGLTIDSVSSMLLMLELRGLVISQAGGVYVQVNQRN